MHIQSREPYSGSFVLPFAVFIPPCTSCLDYRHSDWHDIHVCYNSGIWLNGNEILLQRTRALLYNPLSPTTPTMTVMSDYQFLSHVRNKRDIPSFFPPTKSIPSSIALSINGLTAPVCSLICLAFAHNASDTDWGSKLGRGEGRAGVCETGGANSARTSRISSSYYLSAFFMVLTDGLRDYP